MTTIVEGSIRYLRRVHKPATEQRPSLDVLEFQVESAGVGLFNQIARLAEGPVRLEITGGD